MRKANVAPVFWLPLSFLLLLSSADAQERPPVTPSDGITLPDRSIVESDDATSIETNPAGLGFMKTSELGFGIQFPSESHSGLTHSGAALLMGLGTGFFGLGLGVQWLNRPDLGQGQAEYRKYSFSGAISPGPLSVGITTNLFGSAEDERLDQLMTIDVGAQWRASSILGFGMMIRDANSAFIRDNVSLPSRWEFAVAGRHPRGWFSLETSLAWRSQTQQYFVMPRITLEPWTGIRLFARSALRIQNLPDVSDLVWQEMIAGLEWSFGSLGGQTAPVFTRLPGQQAPTFGGITNYLWLSPNKQRSIIDSQKYWLIVDASSATSEATVSTIFGMRGNTFSQAVEMLERANQDQRVEGVVLLVGNSPPGYAQAWELRSLITRLRQSGRKTIAYLPGATLRGYYLATAAETVVISPTDSFRTGGMQLRHTSIRGALDTLGVEAQFIRIGEYKSAPEALLYDEETQPAREQKEAWLDAYFGEVVASIASARGKSTEDVEAMIAAGPLLPDRAQTQGWVDRIAYPDELEEELRTTHPGRRFVRDVEDAPSREYRWASDPQVAIVTVDGTIIQGKSRRSPFGGDSMVGAESFSQLLESLRKDDQVKAVVIRINSPGGSAVGSDTMYRAVRRLAAEKPVVASMGGAAASGGYYLAAGAKEIFATPNTLTGSVGIFAGKFNIAEIARRWGIRTQATTRGAPTNQDTIFEPWNEQDIQNMSTSIEYMYRLFLEQVAATRPFDAGEMDDIALGRVYAGKDAQQAGLIDQIGGLSDAVKRAEALAGFKEGALSYRVVAPAMLSQLAALSAQASGNDDAPLTIASEILREFLEAASLLLTFGDSEILMMPFEFSVPE